MSPTRLRGVDYRPLTASGWNEFAELFGKRGACGGCWCMLWRQSRARFETRKGEGNRRAMRRIVQRGEEPGILAFHGGAPVGWVAVSPRERYPALLRSRILRPLDDRPVWSVTCLFVHKEFRNRGLSRGLLRAAVDHVRAHGGKIVEGYPVEPRKDRMPDAFAWTGLASAFLSAGFRECARRSATRPIMRYRCRPRQSVR